VGNSINPTNSRHKYLWVIAIHRPKHLSKVQGNQRTIK